MSLVLLTKPIAALSPDEIVVVARLRAERREHGLPIVPSAAELQREAPASPRPSLGARVETNPHGNPDLDEKTEQRICRKLFIAFGCVVYWNSQARASGVTAGIPDLWVFHPALARYTWHEVKRQIGGELRPAQVHFAEYCATCHVPYIAGDRTAAARWLLAIGAATEQHLLECGLGITAAMLTTPRTEITT